MSKHFETTHPQKVMGLYVNLAKALNALEGAGENIHDRFCEPPYVEGITATVHYTPEGRWAVAQG